MNMVADVLLLVGIGIVCWRGYRQRRPWLELLVQLMWRIGNGRGLWGQVFRYAPFIVGWLLLCHWVNTHGWHATAAGGVLLAMTLALHAMRCWEERQKKEKKPCNIYDG